jgi:hypothetical protein
MTADPIAELSIPTYLLGVGLTEHVKYIWGPIDNLNGTPGKVHVLVGQKVIPIVLLVRQYAHHKVMFWYFFTYKE